MLAEQLETGAHNLVGAAEMTHREQPIDDRIGLRARGIAPRHHAFSHEFSQRRIG
jgi:hypothetical protein